MVILLAITMSTNRILSEIQSQLLQAKNLNIHIDNSYHNQTIISNEPY